VSKNMVIIALGTAVYLLLRGPAARATGLAL
jgi:hypothetical protein